MTPWVSQLALCTEHLLLWPKKQSPRGDGCKCFRNTTLGTSRRVPGSLGWSPESICSRPFSGVSSKFPMHVWTYAQWCHVTKQTLVLTAEREDLCRRQSFHLTGEKMRPSLPALLDFDGCTHVTPFPTLPKLFNDLRLRPKSFARSQGLAWTHSAYTHILSLPAPSESSLLSPSPPFHTLSLQWPFLPAK